MFNIEKRRWWKLYGVVDSAYLRQYHYKILRLEQEKEDNAVWLMKKVLWFDGRDIRVFTRCFITARAAKEDPMINELFMRVADVSIIDRRAEARNFNQKNFQREKERGWAFFFLASSIIAQRDNAWSDLAMT